MKLSAQSLTGTYTAIVTPFTNDGSEIDYDSLKRLIDFQINSKVDGLVVSGSTGEAATLSEDEYVRLIEATLSQVAGRIPVVAGVSANSTKKAVATAQVCQELNVAAILLVLPYYNKPSQQGILAHFNEVRHKVDLPIVAYNVPGRTVSNLLPETLAEMCEQNLIIGVKEASGNIEQMMNYLKLVGDKIAVLAGEDYLVYSCMTAGGKGVISASANIMPQLFVEVTSGCLNGEWSKACKAQLNLLPYVKAVFSETNPVPVKEALVQMGIISSNSVRLPLISASEATKDLFKSLL